MRCSRSNRSCRGFTLLELLIALGLSALLLTVIAAALHQVSRDWERGQGRADENLDRVLALLQLERALQGAYPHFHLDAENKESRLFFEGEREELAWVSTVSPRGEGMAAWRLEGDGGVDGEGRSGVVLRLAPAFADDPSERLEEASAELLLADYRASFEYLFEKEKDPDDQQWFDEWSAEERNELPRAVRVVLEPLTDAGEPLEVVAPIAAHRHPKLRPKEKK